jgi:aryl-alcohol dehydrogenase-like predicted oxidoreductase
MQTTGTTATAPMMRTLGHSGISVSAMGLGCWAIGGPFTWGGRNVGWGDVDDAESIRAVRRALELGISFFDTADVYGTGRSERILAKALEGHRDEVVIATKFGNVFDEQERCFLHEDVSPAYVRRACEASLRRLGVEHIDLYQLHVWSVPAGPAEGAAATLEELVAEGKIRAYGWSTDDLPCAELYAPKPGCTAIQHDLSVLDDKPELLAICERHDLASINRSPLAMGLLSGRFSRDTPLPDDDVRGKLGGEWVRFFKDGRPVPEFLDKLEAVREILTSGGRTLVQGALGWIWARSERTIPIPGFKSVRQVEENAGAMAFGPLRPQQMGEIETLLGRRV